MSAPPRLAFQALSLCLLLLLPGVARAESALDQLKPLRLNEAVSDAVDNNTAVKNGRLEIEISQERVAAARTRVLPHVQFTAAGLQLLTPLDFEFNQGVFGTYPATGPIPDQNTKVSTEQKPALFVNVCVAQPILQVARMQLALKQLKLSKAAATEKLRAQRQQIANQVKHAYYRALELEDAMQLVTVTTALYREIDRITNAFIAERTVLKADAIEVQQQLANAEYEELKVRNSLATQKEELNHLLGRNIQNRFSLVLEHREVIALDLPTAQAKALTARADMRQATTQTQQLDLERRIKRLENLPDLTLIVDYLSVFGTQVLPRNLVFAGLVFNWEPWDWGRKMHEYGEKKRQLQQARNSQNELATQISLEVNDSFRKVEEAQKRIEVTQLGQKLAAERLRVLTDKYKEKSALLKDVLQGQRDLTQANNQYTQSVLALLSARADLDKAVGVE